MSKTLPTCFEPGCERVAVVSTITRAGVVGPGCTEHVILHPAVARKRDYTDSLAYRTDRQLDRADRDWLADVATEAIEWHLGQTPIAVELATVYRALTGDGGTWTGAVIPMHQGETATRALLVELAPHVATRVGEEAIGDE